MCKARRSSVSHSQGSTNTSNLHSIRLSLTMVAVAVAAAGAAAGAVAAEVVAVVVAAVVAAVVAEYRSRSGSYRTVLSALWLCA